MNQYEFRCLYIKDAPLIFSPLLFSISLSGYYCIRSLEDIVSKDSSFVTFKWRYKHNKETGVYLI